MSHVDDGTLHAYLDGALDSLGSVEAARVREHLESCEQCARRLEEEGAWRDQAAAVLAGAVPEGEDVPPFEEIRARAAMASSAPAGRSLRRLAWAASVVLAMGTGWMLRGASTRGGVGLRPPTPVMLAPSEESAGLPVSPARNVAEEESRVDEAAPAARAERALADAREARQVVSQESKDTPVEGGRVDSEPADARVAQALPEAAESKVADSNPSVFDAVAGGSAGVTAEAGPVRGERDSSLVLDAEAPARQRLFLAREELPPLGLRSEVARRDAAAPTSPGATTPLGAEQAEEDAVRPVSLSGEAVPLAVPGLEVISVSRLEGAVLEGSVRVLQRLEEGDTLELIHLPPGMNPGAIPTVETDGRTELVVPMELGWLVARARLPRGELERIVRTLAPVAR
jgi:hypothetical protein